MALPRTGKNAKVEYGTATAAFVAQMDSWSLNYDQDMYDATAFTTGTLQSRSFIPGLTTWTAELSGNYAATSTGIVDLRTNALAASTGVVNLYIDKTGGEHWTGNVLIANMTFDAPIDGKIATSFSLQGNGTLTFSTTT